MSKIGLVTVLFKSDDVLDGFIKSISIQDFSNYVLYIVDNSANNITNNLLLNLYKKYNIVNVCYINSGDNVGVAAGNNIGIKEALADGCTDVILLNNDIEFEANNVFTKMISVAKENSSLIVVPKILYYDTRKVWMAGGYMDNLRALGVHLIANNPNDLKVNTPKFITYAPTCFMLINASVFNAIGYMDEKYFTYYDDTDFVFRAIKNKILIYYEPTLIVLHKVSSSSGGDNSLFYIYYSNRNKIYFIRKNYRTLKKWIALLYTLSSRIIYWLKYNKEQRIKLKMGMKDGFRLYI